MSQAAGYLYRLPGATPYAEALALQQQLAAARSQHAVPDVLVVLEHAPVVTLGPRSDAERELPDRAALAARGIEVVETDRGGRATYHGPGQIVAYPIIDLTRLGRDLRRYVALLEEATIAALADLGVAAEVRAGREFVGVWVGDRKIASLGVHVAGWVTTHGIAVNVTTAAAEPFALFTPCGLDDLQVTSVEQETGRAVTVDEVADSLIARLGESLGVLWDPIPGGSGSVTLSAELTVFASDLDVTRAFYADRIGFTIAEVGESSLVAERDGLRLRLEGGARPRKRSRKWLQEAGVLVTLVPDDFDGLLAELRQRGVEILGEITFDAEGRRYAGFADPDGNLFEITERRVAIEPIASGEPVETT